MSNPLIFLGSVVLLASCATVSTPPPVSSGCANQLSDLPQFELQTGVRYSSIQRRPSKSCHNGVCTRFFSSDQAPVYNVARPIAPYENYQTQIRNSPERLVLGLDGPFKLANGKIPVFICDNTDRQFYRFGPSVLYCSKDAGLPIIAALSEDHPHPEGLELGPKKMPESRVPTQSFIWKDGCVDRFTTHWTATRYCIPDGSLTPAIWCEPYKP